MQDKTYGRLNLRTSNKMGEFEKNEKKHRLLQFFKYLLRGGIGKRQKAFEC